MFRGLMRDMGFLGLSFLRSIQQLRNGGKKLLQLAVNKV